MPLELSKGQQDVLDASGHMLVCGGPGSGKTTISILKAAKSSAGLRATQRILFLSFARATVARVIEAIGQETKLTQRERASIEVDTYHSQFWSILKTHGYLKGLPRTLSVLTPSAEAAAVAAITADYKAVSKLTDDERTSRKAAIDLERERLSTEEGRVCFDHFAPKVADLLEGSSRLRKLIASTFPVIVIDEFQDTNFDQWRVVKSLGEFSTLIALADPEQRIFDFIGADPERLQHFVEAFEPTQFDLAGDNYRSKGTDIGTFGNDILKGKFSKSSYSGIDFDTFPSVEALALNKLKSVTLAARGRLMRSGKVDWSLAILVPTKRMTRIISDAFRQTAGNLPAIVHEASVEMDAAILGAEVVAMLLEPGDEVIHLPIFIKLIIEYYRGKSGSEASTTNINIGHSIAKSFEKMTVAVAAGRNVPGNSIMIKLMDVYRQCRSLSFSGDPDADWTLVRGTLEAGACPKLRDIGCETRNVRLLGRGSQLRQSLSQNWRAYGNYRDALAVVRGALVQEHFSNRARPEYGISIMNMHKAKGKQFDEIIIFEGFPRRIMGKIVSNPDRFVRGNLAENITSDNRQNFRVSVTRARKKTTILTPADDICILLKSSG